ncbi:MAG: fibronectin type III domain-containing protein, partial [Desulfamplus sp.]|nr:fibronectin type III domain-containing protein [Desulfamplus sp.]
IRTSNGTHYLTGQSVLAPDQWYHVALTFAGGEMILYIDGKEESRLSVSGQMNVMANQKTTIGANPLGQTPFAGNLDDVRIYDHALTQEEITLLTQDSGTVTDPVPNDPSNLMAAAISSNQINVTWQDNSDNENGFKLERSTDADFSNPVLVTLDENIMSYTDSALIPATLYFYRIYSYNAGGNSEYSNGANALTDSESDGGGQIIVDHTSIDMFNNIPEYYIDQVKKMLFNIPGESHGKAYIYGLEQLQFINPKYAVKVSWSGDPEAYTTEYLRVLRSVRTPNWSNSSGEQHIWTSQTAISWINTHFSYCKNTLNNNIDVFGWGWCWDMTGTNLPGGVIDPVYKVRWAGRSFIGSTDNGRWGLDKEDTALTGNSINMSTYLNAMQNYINNNPDTAIVFTTGPADRSEENGYQNWLKHEYIRNYAKADSKRILFDYADILAHNPSGTISNTSWIDGEGIRHTFPIIYSGYRVEYDGGLGSGHISQDACVRLGKATWYMLARIAGWNGIDQ